LDPQINAFLERLDEINEQYRTLRGQMLDYLREHDFQRETAIGVISQWIASGTMPQAGESESADATASSE
jgi:hypothetical protein